MNRVLRAPVGSRPRSRRGVLAAAAVAGLLAAATLLWFTAEAQLASAFVHWADTVRAAGWRLSYAPPAWAGFPWAARLVLKRFRLEGGEKTVPEGVAWSADRLTLSVSPFHPFRLTVEPDGNEQLRLSRLPAAAFTADMLGLSVPLAGGTARMLTVEAAGLAGGLAGAKHQGDVRVARLSIRASVDAPPHGAPWGHDAGSISLSAEKVALPDIRQWPLGDTVAFFGLDADFISPLLGTGDPRAEAIAWRDGHGHVHAGRLALRWGPLDVSAHAGFALDAALQPAGSGEAVVSGHAEALEALAKGGALPEGIASTAEAVLGLMAAAPAEAGRKAGAVRLPFAVKASTLSVGHIPLYRFGQIEWGSGDAEN